MDPESVRDRSAAQLVKGPESDQSELSAAKASAEARANASPLLHTKFVKLRMSNLEVLCSNLSFDILSSICCNFLVPRSPHSQGCVPGGPLLSTSGPRRGLDGHVWVGRSWWVVRHQGVRPVVVHGDIRHVVEPSFQFETRQRWKGKFG